MLDCLKPITHKKLIEHELEGERALRAGACGRAGLARWVGGWLRGRVSGRRGWSVGAPVRCTPSQTCHGLWHPAEQGAARGRAPLDLDRTGATLANPPLAGFGIRLNKKPPEITFRRKDKGGINYTSAVQNPKLDLEGADGLGPGVD